MTRQLLLVPLTRRMEHDDEGQMKPSHRAKTAADALVLELANHFGDVAKFYTPNTCSRVAIALDQFAAERANIMAELRKALGLDDDRHARHNLDGALIDIEHDAEFRTDHVCRKTIRRVMEQLADVEKIIERGEHAPPEPATRVRE